MTYAYDILLNFTDEDRLLEFYEWNENDYIEHIKRVPIFYILERDLIVFFSHCIKIDKNILLKIKNKTISYGRDDNLEYCALFSDGNKVIAIEFNSEGIAIARSGLLLDEENEIIDETIGSDIIKVKYDIINSDKNFFVTRKESFIKKYLLLELEEIRRKLEVDKLDYLYSEIFKKDTLSFDKKINRLINDINNNFNKKYNELYNLLRIMHTTK